MFLGNFLMSISDENCDIFSILKWRRLARFTSQKTFEHKIKAARVWPRTKDYMEMIARKPSAVGLKGNFIIAFSTLASL